MQKKMQKKWVGGGVRVICKALQIEKQQKLLRPFLTLYSVHDHCQLNFTVC